MTHNTPTSDNLRRARSDRKLRRAGRRANRCQRAYPDARRTARPGNCRARPPARAAERRAGKRGEGRRKAELACHVAGLSCSGTSQRQFAEARRWGVLRCITARPCAYHPLNLRAPLVGRFVFLLLLGHCVIISGHFSGKASHNRRSHL